MTTEPITPISIPKSPEDIAQDISASYDSVTLITQIVAADQHSDEIHDTMDRNVRHLQQCLMLTHIMENATDEDKIAFADAVTLGEDWVGS